MNRTRIPILTLFAANAVSLSGNVAALVAIPWFVLQTTGSASKTGITAFAGLLPVVLSGLFGGALVDRLGYRRMSIVGDLASAVSVAAIPILSSTIGLEFWQLVVLVFLGGLLDAPGGTARTSLLPDVAERAGWTFERASGLTAVIERASRLAGAPLAGVLIAVVGATNVLWIDAGSFLVSAALIALGVPRPAKRPARETRTRYLHELREGFRFLRRDHTLATLIGVVTLTNMLDAVSLVLLPVYAVEVYGTSLSLGLMWAAVGAGSIAGALAFAAWGDRVSRRAVYTWGFIMVTVWYPVAAAFPPLAILIAAKVVAGIASGPINPVIDTVFFERVPDGMRGRVFGVTQAMAWVAMPLGVLVAGPLIESLGLRTTLLVSFALYLAVTVGARFLPSLRDLDRRPSPAADGEAVPSVELAPVAGGAPWAGPPGERASESA
jgi:MFS family permease